MPKREHGRLSADVKTTAYLKFRRVYEDAVKARAEGRPLEARFVLRRALLHVPPLLAAAEDESVPGPWQLPEWEGLRRPERRGLFLQAWCSSGLAAAFTAAAELDGLLRRRIPQPGPIWESGRMRFTRRFTSDTLFFPAAQLRILRWWDHRRDRREIVPGLERFLDLVRRGSPQDGGRFRELLLEAFRPVPGLHGILIFGSSAHGNTPWNDSGGRDVDLALIGRGFWFRRGICGSDGIRLDILRLPGAILRKGVEAEDDLITNALFTAELLRDDTGGCRALQERVRGRYLGGKTRPRGEARERLVKDVVERTEWARPQGSEPADRVRLEVGLSAVLKAGYRMEGLWFPADQAIPDSLGTWSKEAAERLRDYVLAEGSEAAYEHLRALGEILCRAGSSTGERPALSRERDGTPAPGREPQPEADRSAAKPHPGSSPIGV